MSDYTSILVDYGDGAVRIADRPQIYADQPGDEDDKRTPMRPDIDRPNRGDVMKRMKRVDPDLAKRYRQKPGE